MKTTTGIGVVLFLTVLFCAVHSSIGRIAGNSAYSRNTKIPDFRYSSARIDGITRLVNGTWLILSNGHYWMLRNSEVPHKFNVRGSISQLYNSMAGIDSVWVDPSTEDAPQLFLIENTPNRGLNVVCQEFDNPFSSQSKFCHLPVTNAWHTALRDLDPKRSVDAVTWRNRTIIHEGGYWVFFQGHQMIIIDPFDMRLRSRYDLREWMRFNDTITAAHYDYERSVYHLFFDNNGYRTWKVNETYMSSLPMGWDRGFLHGELSPLMKINRDFFGFQPEDLVDYSQPYFERFVPTVSSSSSSSSSFAGNKPNQGRNTSDRSKYTPISSTTTSTTTTTTTTRRPVTSTESDVLYVTSRKNILQNKNRNRNSHFSESDDHVEEVVSNTLEKDESISYQRQLMEFDREGVKDFGLEASVNSLPTRRVESFLLLFCIFIVCLLV